MNKGTGIILAAALLMHAFPLSASAADTQTKANGETVSVHVTIRTESVVLDHAEVTAGDENEDGQLTLEDVLIAAHDTYYDGGAEAGYVRSCDRAPELSVIWGVRGNYISFMQDRDGMEKTGAPENGDSINVLARYADPERYSFRHSSKNKVAAGESVRLKLMRKEPDSSREEPVCNAAILIDGRQTGFRTNEQGWADVVFRDAGQHSVSAKLNGTALLMQSEQFTVSESTETTVSMQTADSTASTNDTTLTKNTLPTENTNLTGESGSAGSSRMTTDEPDPAASLTTMLSTTVSSAFASLKTKGVSAGESAPLAAFCGAGAAAMAALLIFGKHRESDELSEKK
ncbi:MAG: hypothetical protein IKI77_08430 [Oscillospiraceae bacterium]|nr:hypothetical protein [Oscillospiraceae bacterium]